MILDSINCPEDLRNLDREQLPELCRDLRSYIIECCSHNPGHLGSSLGAVEIITALHYVFNTPDDKLVFDVGHQSYAHKILTGRREAFKSIRSAGGPSGFPNMKESIYDAFGAGHSSTSISAALGLAEAARLQGLKRRCVAVIGDGALTGGLAFEGLNNVSASKADLLIILNDNNQSIDKNIGGLHNYLLRITTRGAYNRIKDQVWDALGENGLRNFIQRWSRSLKSWMVKKSGGDYFEALGFRYFGPVDGNDIDRMVESLSLLKDMKGPRILHCITRKGKGYAPAEADPTTWHAPGKYDVASGQRQRPSYSADRYQDVFGEVLCELAASDSRIVGITPAMASGCGMNKLAERFPGQFFDVGIEEEHAATFSAGLAAGGMKPFCNIYSSFAQRAYDQIIHDIALQGLPVTLCFDRAGVVGEDGATHQGAFDLAAYRSVPGIIISSPRNETELKNLMYTAASSDCGPFIIRYPRGTGEGSDWKNTGAGILEIGKAEELLRGDKIAIIGIGPCVNRALEAARQASDSIGVYNFRFLKPLDTRMLDEISKVYKAVITVEDGCLKGGLGSAVCEYFASIRSKAIIRSLGIPDEFITHDSQASQRQRCSLDCSSILEAVTEMESILSQP